MTVAGLVGLVACEEGFDGLVTVVLGLLPVVLPGFLSVDVLTAGREADLTPELLVAFTLDLED